MSAGQASEAPEQFAEIEECSCGGHLMLTLIEGRSVFSKTLTAAEAAALGRLLSTAGEAMLAKGAGVGADRRH